MASFCPFFGFNVCPEKGPDEGGCAVWTDFGCCMIDKPGDPAIYTDPPNDPVDVYVLQKFSEKAAINDGLLILYALASDGTWHLSDDYTKFKSHLL